MNRYGRRSSNSSRVSNSGITDSDVRTTPSKTMANERARTSTSASADVVADLVRSSSPRLDIDDISTNDSNMSNASRFYAPTVSSAAKININSSLPSSRPPIPSTGSVSTTMNGSQGGNTNNLPPGGITYKSVSPNSMISETFSPVRQPILSNILSPVRSPVPSLSTNSRNRSTSPSSVRMGGGASSPTVSITGGGNVEDFRRGLQEAKQREEISTVLHTALAESEARYVTLRREVVSLRNANEQLRKYTDEMTVAGNDTRDRMQQEIDAGAKQITDLKAELASFLERENKLSEISSTKTGLTKVQEMKCKSDILSRLLGLRAVGETIQGLLDGARRKLRHASKTAEVSPGGSTFKVSTKDAASAEKKVTAAQATFESLVAAQEQLSQEIMALTRIVPVDAQIIELSEHNEALRAELKKGIHEINKLTNERDSLRTELAQQNLDHHKTMDILTQNHDEAMTKIREELAANADAYHTQETAAATLHEQTLQALTEKYEETITQLYSELKEKELTFHNQTIAVAELHAAELQEQRNQTNKVEELLTTKFNESKEDFHRELQALTATLAHTQSSLDKSQQDAKHAHERCEQLEKDLDSIRIGHAKELTSLNDEATSSATRIAEFQSVIERLNERLQERTGRVTFLEEELAKVKEIAQTNATNAEQAALEVRSRVAEAEAANKTSAREMERSATLDAELSAVHEALGGVRSDLQRAKQELETSLTVQKELEDEKGTLSHKVDALISQIESLTAQSEAMRDELQSLEETLQTKTVETKALTTMNTELSTSLQKETERALKAEESNDTLRHELTHVHLELNTVMGRETKLQEEHQAQGNVLNDMTQRASSAESQVVKLLGDAQNNRQTMDAQTQRIVQLETDLIKQQNRAQTAETYGTNITTELTATKAKLGSTEEKIVQLETSLLETTENLTVTMNRAADLDNQVTVLTQEIADQKIMNTVTTDELTGVQNSLIETREKLELYQKRSLDADDQVIKLLKEIEVLRMDDKAAHTLASTLREQLEHFTKESDDQRTRAEKVETQLQQIIKDNEENRTSSIKTMDQLRSEISSATQKTEIETKKLQDEISIRDKQLADAITRAANAESHVMKLLSDMDFVKAADAVIHREVRHKEAEIADVTAQDSKHAKQAAAAEAQVLELTKELKYTKAEIEIVRDKLTAAEELIANHKTEVASLNKELEQIRSDLKKERTRANAADERITSLIKELDSSKSPSSPKEIKAGELQRMKMQIERETERATVAENRLKDIGKEMDVLKTQVQDSEKEIITLRSEVETHRKENYRLNHQLTATSSSTAYTGALEALQRSEEKVMKLTEELTTVKDRESQLSIELQAVRVASGKSGSGSNSRASMKVEGQIKEYLTTLKDLENKLKQEKASAKEALERAETAEKAVQSLNTRVEVQKINLANMAEQLEKAEAELEGLKH